MFTTLESNWDQSARRRWTTLASFTMQAFGLSLVLAIPFLWVQCPPQLHWLEQLAPPTAFTPPAPSQAARGHSTATQAGDQRPNQITAPPSIPPNIDLDIATANDADQGPPAPDFSAIGTGPGRGSGVVVPGGWGPDVIPARPAAVKPLLVSHLAEANLLHRVQPIYPPIARQAHVQGTVELRAIISKAGTIENLIVVRGHPMLVKPALEAVRQWRYRPYLLNNEPIEVETEITVNFVLSGG
jgi:protein TonB